MPGRGGVTTASSRPMRVPRPPSRSRFHEGSMKDRASAVPPVAFLGPPALESRDDGGTRVATTSPPRGPPGAHAAAAAGGHSRLQRTAGRGGHSSSTSLFGQMWDGVKGRLRWRRDAASGGRHKGRDGNDDGNDNGDGDDGNENDNAREALEGDRPSRDDVWQSYQQLVASGFFAAHAIHASRPRQQPQQQPQRQHPASRPSTAHWPLPNTRGAAAVCTTGGTSVSSFSPTTAARGTKRAPAADDGDGSDHDGGSLAGAQHNDSEDMALRPRSAKRTRTSADPPQQSLRSIPSRRRLRPRNSAPTVAAPAPGPAPAREPNKLVKRGAVVAAATPAPGPGHAGPRTRARARAQSRNGRKTRLDVPARVSSSRRIVSAAGPLTARRDINAARSRFDNINNNNNNDDDDDDDDDSRDVVPPSKFTYGEDWENGAPWRGLRR